MPELSASLTWALPVRIEKLGAHVEAYVETLPAITALRLCNKFGKGPESHIKKLPNELVDAIAELVVKPEREKRLVLWTQLLRCYTGQCNAENGHPLTGEENMCYSDHDCVREDCAYQLHEFYTAAHREVCLDNQREFENELKHGSLCGHKKLLKAHFGIALWISPTCSGVDGWTALAYLTLPDDPGRTETWPDNDPPYNFLSNDTGYGIPVRMGVVPSPTSLERFPRALKKLGLEVFVHRSQEGAKTLSAGNRKVEKSDAVNGTAVDEGEIRQNVEWPELTLLVHSAPKSDG